MLGGVVLVVLGTLVAIIAEVKDANEGSEALNHARGNVRHHASWTVAFARSFGPEGYWFEPSRGSASIPPTVGTAAANGGRWCTGTLRRSGFRHDPRSGRASI